MYLASSMAFWTESMVVNIPFLFLLFPFAPLLDHLGHNGHGDLLRSYRSDIQPDGRMNAL